MTRNRFEAFSDGVIAIIITIMVLELRVPLGASFSALRPLAPVFLSYVLSFIFIGIYWNNHRLVRVRSGDLAGAGSKDRKNNCARVIDFSPCNWIKNTDQCERFLS